jgi:hypothetical protein
MRLVMPADILKVSNIRGGGGEVKYEVGFVTEDINVPCVLREDSFYFCSCSYHHHPAYAIHLH